MVKLTIDGWKDCYVLDPGRMRGLQDGANTTDLDPGQYRFRVGERFFRFGPPVLLWIYGGRVIDPGTGATVERTWCSLDDPEGVLTLRVLEPTRVCALFLNTRKPEERELVRVSIERIA